MLCGSWLGIALNNVRFRRRESSVDNQAVENTPQCISTSQMINRSFPSVFDTTQFTPMHPASYVEPLPNPCVTSPGHLRTAIVGPHTVGHEYDSEMKMCSGDVVARMSRSLYENGCNSGVSVRSTPKRREVSSGPVPHRRGVQGMDGGLYQLCNGSPARECPSFVDVDMYPSGSRAIRPRDLRLTPSSSASGGDDAVFSVKSPTTPSNRLSLSNGMNFQLTSVDKRPGISNGGSKKVMVAPQPHYRSHNEDRNDDDYRNVGDPQIIHRRQSGGPVASYPQHYENRHGFPREISMGVMSVNDHPMNYDERNGRGRQSGDVRVTALEKRVRELEAVITNGSGQVSTSPSSSSTSFIVPVSGKSPQLIVSSVSSATTQQLMAQEIADREVEIERLQSQLRQCYSRMELRKVQFDEEVEKFRKESVEAKLQLEKVKSRLNELERECCEYREKATQVEAARTSAIETSLEKITTQEKELSCLRGEVEQLTALSAELDAVKEELKGTIQQNCELRSTLSSKDRSIQDLEDSIYSLKMEASCKLGSGSATPCEEEFSLMDMQTPKYLGGIKELQELTPRPNGRKAQSVTSAPSSRLKKSRSSHQLAASSEKINLSPLFSALIRKQLSRVLECRLLAKCLKDTASKAMSGDLPSVNRLLGCRSESMSESDADNLPTDQSPMSLLLAERHIRKGTEDLQRVESDLNELREKFVEYYEKKVVEDLRNDETCKIQ